MHVAVWLSLLKCESHLKRAVTTHTLHRYNDGHSSVITRGLNTVNAHLHTVATSRRHVIDTGENKNTADVLQDDFCDDNVCACTVSTLTVLPVISSSPKMDSAIPICYMTRAFQLFKNPEVKLRACA